MIYLHYTNILNVIVNSAYNKIKSATHLVSRLKQKTRNHITKKTLKKKKTNNKTITNTPNNPPQKKYQKKFTVMSHSRRLENGHKM